MDESWVEQIVEAIKPLADKLGEGAEALWHMSVREAIVTGITDLVFGLVFASLIYVTYRVRSHALQSDEWTRDGIVGIKITSMIAMGLFAIVALVLFDNAIHGLVNPHWKAVRIIFWEVSKL